ncbi:hypothetical protein [Pelagicoccus sp. SDUM812003]|uniref:hypothetical protein n=1 Tax=Pelagicoccus sp. SDUM812003 TaxID=3041267 RepID=UPI00280C4A84|nr:hypothetical protein [Pelagicoccus sp. SDUM812003]MDQ8205727.1 hypothetical protein [Pelagicoccus sp. SDUM812003]
MPYNSGQRSALASAYALDVRQKEMNPIQSQLREIAKESYLHDLDTTDETELEAYFLRIIKIAKEEKEETVSFFRSAIWKEFEHPESMIPFCMRELKWIEVKNEANKRFEDERSPRLMNWVSDINHAFEKEWNDEEFWPYFRKKNEA